MRPSKIAVGAFLAATLSACVDLDSSNESFNAEFRPISPSWIGERAGTQADGSAEWWNVTSDVVIELLDRHQSRYDDRLTFRLTNTSSEARQFRIDRLGDGVVVDVDHRKMGVTSEKMSDGEPIHLQGATRATKSFDLRWKKLREEKRGSRFRFDASVFDGVRWIPLSAEFELCEVFD